MIGWQRTTELEEEGQQRRTPTKQLDTETVIAACPLVLLLERPDAKFAEISESCLEVVSVRHLISPQRRQSLLVVGLQRSRLPRG
jgi:hypothetical protein